MTTHKAIELVASVYGLVMVQIFLWAIVHGGKKKPTPDFPPRTEPDLLAPYKSYQLMREAAWRDKR